MRLDVLTKHECEKVRLWRNQALETLRTPQPLTAEQQEAFYRDVVCNPQSRHRYWALIGENGAPLCFMGMGGLTYIQVENRLAEISLILDPEVRGMGLGEQAVDLLLAEGFDRMGLKTIFGECYECNPDGVVFWNKVRDKYSGFSTWLPCRKFWAGEFHSSLYFSIDANSWREAHHGTA